MSVLVCPVCGEMLNNCGKALKCRNNHCFDIAKEGYVNLLLGSKSGDKRGDSRQSVHARREFLEKGYYSFLRDFICEKMCGTVLDICCGEGYYDKYDGELFGFDISKETVRLASKAHKDNFYFTANLASIPIQSESIDTAIHLFAPFNEKEFARLLKKGGRLFSVIPGENHLFELKKIVYDKPYKNDEKKPPTSILKLKSRHKISRTFSIGGDDLKTLFSMTPYFYRTSEKDKAKLESAGGIDLTAEFVILEYEKEM